MRMKKIFLILCGLLPLFFTSCGDDEDEDKEPIYIRKDNSILLHNESGYDYTFIVSSFYISLTSDGKIAKNYTKSDFCKAYTSNRNSVQTLNLPTGAETYEKIYITQCVINETIGGQKLGSIKNVWTYSKDLTDIYIKD